MSGWKVGEVKKMKVGGCDGLFEFYVGKGGVRVKGEKKVGEREGKVDVRMEKVEVEERVDGEGVVVFEER